MHSPSPDIKAKTLPLPSNSPGIKGSSKPPPLASPSKDAANDSLPSLKRKNHSHDRRQRKRNKLCDEFGHPPTPRAIERHMMNAQPIQASLSAHKLPNSSNPFAGKKHTPQRGDKKAWTPAQLESQGLTLVAWDGSFSQMPRETRPILDRNNRVIAVLVGQPAVDDFQGSANAAYDALSRGRQSGFFASGSLSHHRGRYPVLNVGVTHGKGTSWPVYLNNHENNDVARLLLEDTHIKRLANFASAFNAGFPTSMNTTALI
ncbi:hypothetical protein C0991_007323 [Blastosporella zonata]|nr:hypothetical protein C0991_007323 [Blastosporella zonata]